jgi:hypothetical protein
MNIDGECYEWRNIGITASSRIPSLVLVLLMIFERLAEFVERPLPTSHTLDDDVL